MTDYSAFNILSAGVQSLGRKLVPKPSEGAPRPPAPVVAEPFTSGVSRKRARKASSAEDGALPSFRLISAFHTHRLAAGVSVFAAAAAPAPPAHALPDGGEKAAATAAAAAAAAANALRRAHRIRVSRSASAPPPPPLASFEELVSLYGAPAWLPRRVASLLSSSTSAPPVPTPVQRQAIPAMLAGHELLVCAPTGSGKTVAFLLPLLLLLASHESGGPRAAVLAPSRELAAQTWRVAVVLLASGWRGLKAAVVTRASSASGPGAFGSADIVVTTPGRLAAAVEAGALSLAAVRWVVLDEADKLLDDTFAAQTDAALAACASPPGAPPKVLRLSAFSATLPEAAEAAARSVMVGGAARITVGDNTRGGAAPSVAQRLVFTGDESGKLLALKRELADPSACPRPVLVFCQSGERAAQLAEEVAAFRGLASGGAAVGGGVGNNITSSLLRVGAIHGELSSTKRASVVDSFRRGALDALIATDVLSRGIDFSHVGTVLSFDFPTSITAHVHRVGRAGRAGRAGAAVTFFTEGDAPRLRAIANCVVAAGGKVPEWMLSLKKGAHRASGGEAGAKAPKRAPVTTRTRFDRIQERKVRTMKAASKRKRAAQAGEAAAGEL